MKEILKTKRLLLRELNTDIGFRLFEEHWNKGFATESSKACIEYGFENLNLKSIIGRAMKENLVSIKVLKKNQFEV